MSNTQFVVLALIMLFGFGLLDRSGCGCLVFIVALAGAGVAVLI